MWSPDALLAGREAALRTVLPGIGSKFHLQGVEIQPEEFYRRERKCNILLMKMQIVAEKANTQKQQRWHFSLQLPPCLLKLWHMCSDFLNEAIQL
jgi:hypothetical protein